MDLHETHQEESVSTGSVNNSEEITYTNGVGIDPIIILLSELYKLYYYLLNSQVSNPDEIYQTILSILNSPKSRKISFLAWELQAFTKYELQVKTGLLQQTVDYTVKRLKDQGFVEEKNKVQNVQDGRPPSLFLFLGASPDETVKAQKRYFRLLRNQLEMDVNQILQTQRKVEEYLTSRGIKEITLINLRHIFDIDYQVLQATCQKINRESVYKIWV